MRGVSSMVLRHSLCKNAPGLSQPEAGSGVEPTPDQKKNKKNNLMSMTLCDVYTTLIWQHPFPQGSNKINGQLKQNYYKMIS